MHLFRRESPWKVDGESSGVPAKLKLLEQELINLEKVGKGDLSKIPTLMRKQAKRYQSLAGKIDDLCRRMVGSNLPILSTLLIFITVAYFIYSCLKKRREKKGWGVRLRLCVCSNCIVTHLASSAMAVSYGPPDNLVNAGARFLFGQIFVPTYKKRNVKAR